MKRNAERGFTLIEVIVAGVIITLAAALLVASLQYCMRASQTAREKTAALNGARAMVERLRGTPARHIYSAYGPGGTDGPDFDVEGLRAADGDADGRCGKMTFYDDESADAPEVGLPRDLNGDGDTDDSGADVTDNYRLVPVKITVSWRGVAGNKSTMLYAVIGDRHET